MILKEEFVQIKNSYLTCSQLLGTPKFLSLTDYEILDKVNLDTCKIAPLIFICLKKKKKNIHKELTKTYFRRLVMSRSNGFIMSNTFWVTYT